MSSISIERDSLDTNIIKELKGGGVILDKALLKAFFTLETRS